MADISPSPYFTQAKTQSYTTTTYANTPRSPSPKTSGTVTISKPRRYSGSHRTNYDELTEDFYTLSPSPSPEPVPTLQSRLIGAWRLESYTAYPLPTSKIQRPTFPMTKNVTGLIMYTPDGYMSAQMLIPGQKSFKRGEGEESQYAEAGKRSFSYAGPYYISNEGEGREEVLRHTFMVCNLPGWVGDLQVRTWRFEEDGQVLVLGSEEPTEIKGDKRIPVLKWRRARNNTHGSPPPPMPQIKVSGPGEP
ncbi:hypothetical protein MBLNU457_7377t1 [Dothideomycetes sp. NU457]